MIHDGVSNLNWSGSDFETPVFSFARMKSGTTKEKQ
jgi:hypothetical protein